MADSKLLSETDAQKLFPVSAEVINKGREILMQSTDEVPIKEIANQFLHHLMKHGVVEVEIKDGEMFIKKRKIHTDLIMVHIETLGVIASSFVLLLFFTVFDKAYCVQVFVLLLKPCAET